MSIKGTEGENYMLEQEKEFNDNMNKIFYHYVSHTCGPHGGRKVCSSSFKTDEISHVSHHHISYFVQLYTKETEVVRQKQGNLKQCFSGKEIPTKISV